MACDISPVASFFLWSSPRAIKLKSGFLYCQDSSDPLCQSPIIKQTLVQKSENTGSLMTIPECNGMQGCDNDFYRVLCLFMDRECVFMLACLFVCSLPKVQDLTVFLFKCSLNTIWRFVCMLSFIIFLPYSLFVVLIGEGAKIGR